jgi:hypothetical protein
MVSGHSEEHGDGDRRPQQPSADHIEGVVRAEHDSGRADDHHVHGGADDDRDPGPTRVRHGPEDRDGTDRERGGSGGVAGREPEPRLADEDTAGRPGTSDDLLEHDLPEAGEARRHDTGDRKSPITDPDPALHREYCGADRHGEVRARHGHGLCAREAARTT